jgi:tungstate transport system ATP-binding protein
MHSAYLLRDIKSGYDGNIVLDISELLIDKGSIAALVGPNGSGKSTLFNLLAFLATPMQGEIIFQDQSIDNNKISSYRRKVGYVQQNPYLLRGSIFHNLEIGLKFHGVPQDKRYVKVMEIMELLGIENMAQRSVYNLSGGEAQKVAIGRVLVLDPEVLLFDEPFTYLDRRFVDELEDLVATLKTDNGQTIVFSTHNQLQAQVLADKVFSLVNGKVTTAPLSNLFNGEIDTGNSTFNTGNLNINILESLKIGHHLAIDPSQIVLSRHKLDSSMQNSFEGRITGMLEENGQIRVIVESHEKFQILITRMALTNLSFNVGDTVWVSFKSSSVQLF